MTVDYKLPDLPPDPAPVMVIVRDPTEIAAIQSDDVRRPIGEYDETLKEWKATRDSLEQYRQSKQFDVRAKFPEPRK